MSDLADLINKAVTNHELHCKKLSKYISQPVPTTGHNPDRYKYISLGYLFGSVQDDILLPNKYPYRSTQISSVCKLGCGILFVLGLFIDQISLLVPGKIHSRFRFLPACSWFSVLPWPHTLPCLGFSATPQPHLLTRLHSLLSTTLAMAVPPSCPDYTPSGLPISLKNRAKTRIWAIFPKWPK